MPIYVGDSGVSKEPTQTFVGDAGVWKEAQEVWVGDAGVWKQTASAGAGADVRYGAYESFTQSGKACSGAVDSAACYAFSSNCRVQQPGSYSGRFEILPGYWADIRFSKDELLYGNTVYMGIYTSEGDTGNEGRFPASVGFASLFIGDKEYTAAQLSTGFTDWYVWEKLAFSRLPAVVDPSVTYNTYVTTNP